MRRRIVAIGGGHRLAGSLRAVAPTAAHVTAVCPPLTTAGARGACESRGTSPHSGYDLAAHVSALDRHGVHVDVVLAQRGALPTGGIDVEVVEVEVAAPGRRVHDPAALGAALAAIAG